MPKCAQWQDGRRRLFWPRDVKPDLCMALKRCLNLWTRRILPGWNITLTRMSRNNTKLQDGTGLISSALLGDQQCEVRTDEQWLRNRGQDLALILQCRKGPLHPQLAPTDPNADRTVANQVSVVACRVEGSCSGKHTHKQTDKLSLTPNLVRWTPNLVQGCNHFECPAEPACLFVCVFSTAQPFYSACRN